MTTPVGRRERKKAATRQALADAALNLFIERGYDAVTLHEIAEAADVSTTTLLKHFPSKEALVFDKEADQEAGLVAAVRDRAPGVTVPQTLCAYVKRVRRRRLRPPRTRMERPGPAVRSRPRLTLVPDVRRRGPGRAARSHKGVRPLHKPVHSRQE